MTWRNLLRVVLAVLVPRIAATDSERDEEPTFDELAVVNSPTTKTESLERTLDRAESVLEGQLTYLTDTHDKAVRTVRIGVVLLGVIASSSELVPSAIPLNGWIKASLALVVGSIAAGIFTSSSSSPDYGPGPSYVRSNIETGDRNEDVYLKLLQGYQEAISYNRYLVNDSTKYLFVTRVLLGIGIVAGAVGTIVF